eukprot:ANDGO_03918.mRNA.1 hypothetical protein
MSTPLSAVSKPTHGVEFLMTHTVILLAICSVIVAFSFLFLHHFQIAKGRRRNLLFLLIADLDLLNIFVVLFSIAFHAISSVIPGAPMLMYFTDSLERFFWNGSFFVSIACIFSGIPYAYLYAELSDEQSIDRESILFKSFRVRKSGLFVPWFEALVTILIVDCILAVLSVWMKIPLIFVAVTAGAALHLVCVCRGFLAMCQLLLSRIANVIQTAPSTNGEFANSLPHVQTSSSNHTFGRTGSSVGFAARKRSFRKFSGTPLWPARNEDAAIDKVIEKLKSLRDDWSLLIESRHIKTPQQLLSTDPAVLARGLSHIRSQQVYEKKVELRENIRQEDRLVSNYIRSPSHLLNCDDAVEKLTSTCRKLMSYYRSQTLHRAGHFSSTSKMLSGGVVVPKSSTSRLRRLFVYMFVRLQFLLLLATVVLTILVWAIAASRIFMFMFGYQEKVSVMLFSWALRMSPSLTGTLLDVLLLTTFTMASFIGVIDFPYIGLRSFRGWVVYEEPSSHDKSGAPARVFSWNVSMSVGLALMSLMAMSLPTLMAQIGLLSNTSFSNLRDTVTMHFGTLPSSMYFLPLFVSGFLYSLFAAIRGLFQLFSRSPSSDDIVDVHLLDAD